MSADLRGLVYPLQAVHQRESWALDKLQAALAAATQRASAAADAFEQLRQRHGRAAAASVPTPSATIDPHMAQARLLHLADLQRRLQRAGDAHEAMQSERDRAREAVQRQQVKLEGLECHRDAFLRAEATAQERRLGVEADRDWLARSQWRRTFAPERVMATRDATPRGNIR